MGVLDLLFKCRGSSPKKQYQVNNSINNLCVLCNLCG